MYDIWQTALSRMTYISAEIFISKHILMLIRYSRTRTKKNIKIIFLKTLLEDNIVQMYTDIFVNISICGRNKSLVII